MSELRWVSTSKGEVEVEIDGPSAGAPIVLVHGALVSGTIWRPLVAELSRRHRCFVPTLPLGSHRRAMRPEADLSPAGVADLVVELAGLLGLDRFTLVGNDSGGAVSQLLAGRHRERVRALVLTNCDALEVFPPRAFGYLKPVASRPSVSAWMLRAIAAVPALGLTPLAWGWLSPRVTRADVHTWTEPGARDAGVRDDLARFMRGVSGAVTLAAADALAARPLPLHLVWGDADPFFSLTLAERLAARIPGTTLQRIRGGHTYVMLDAPVEVADAITRVVAGSTARDTTATP